MTTLLAVFVTLAPPRAHAQFRSFVQPPLRRQIITDTTGVVRLTPPAGARRALIRAWGAGGEPEPYGAGSAGPNAADDLLARDGRRWLPLDGE